MERPDLEELSDAEISALTAAATWYAKYHARSIAEHADDPSALAVGRRERYEELLSGLRKLGIRLPSVEILAEDIRSARDAGERQAA